MSTRRRAGPAAAASLLLHAVALTALVLAAGRLRPPEPPLTPVALELIPPATSLAPASSTTDPTSRSVQRPASATALAAPLRQVSPTRLPAIPASALPPSPAPTSGAVATAPAATGGGGADGAEARALAALRALTGCAHLDALRASTAERERCAARLADGVRQAARVDVMPPEKRAYFDAVQAAYARVRDGGGTPGRTPVGPPTPEGMKGQASFYLPGVGCAMKFGAPRGWKPYHDRPPHSLKLGRLPCFVVPPQAAGTEESGVEAAASLRERTDDAAHMRKLDPPPG